MKYKIGIVGLGFVGNAILTGFETYLSDKIEIKEFDKYKNTESLYSLVKNSNIIFICLPSPMREDGSCNTDIVEKEIQNIVNIANFPKYIIIKSTITPGLTKKLQESYPKHIFIFNPEFLREKNWYEDFINQDRIILGCERDISIVESLYKDFAKMQKLPAKIIKCKSSEAEMLKYVTNSFLAVKLSFFNEIYQICKVSGIEYDNVVDLLKLDKRIGFSHMQVPGPDGQFGWSLSCLPKDINALISFAKEYNLDPIVLESAWTKNLLVRENYDWENLAQVNGDYKKI